MYAVTKFIEDPDAWINGHRDNVPVQDFRSQIYQDLSHLEVQSRSPPDNLFDGDDVRMIDYAPNPIASSSHDPTPTLSQSRKRTVFHANSFARTLVELSVTPPDELWQDWTVKWETALQDSERIISKRSKIKKDHDVSVSRPVTRSNTAETKVNLIVVDSFRNKLLQDTRNCSWNDMYTFLKRNTYRILDADSGLLGNDLYAERQFKSGGVIIMQERDSKADFD